MSATLTDKDASGPSPGAATTSATRVPKRITNAQTVCNEKNEKGKLCNGHLKQLRTAGEPAEIHLRGDDVLFKCQICGTLYMGPPLGHVRDPQKQSRFVEAELSALLQAAGGTLPVIKKDERGVYVLAESGTGHGPTPAKAVPAKPAETTAAPQSAPAAAVAKTQKATPPVASKPAAQKAGAQPNRQLFKRTTYAGVVDTGPVPGESFAQKTARLQAVAAGAKQRAEEGGGDIAVSPQASSVAPSDEAKQVPPTATSIPAQESSPVPAAETRTATPAPQAAPHKPTGQADRTLMKRYTYGGVVDSGPVPGETFAQKVERLGALAAAAKERAEQGGQ